MIIVKDIPDIIKVNTKSYSTPLLILPSDENKYKSEELEEIKNTAISGVVIKRINSWGNVEVYDPRGFSCCITNFDDLIDKVDISRGVIQEDLWYGLRNTRDGSWMLLTADMKNQSQKAIKSVKDLKPGYVYRLYSDTPLVYLGRLKWKDDYGTPRPHHSFVDPEKREITYHCWLKGSDFKELGYDAPDIYKEAKEILSGTYQGSSSIKVSQISLLPDLKYTTYHHSLLMPESFKELEMWRGDRRVVIFANQIDKENIRLVRFDSDAYRTQKYEDYYEPGSWSRRQRRLDIIEYRMEITDISISACNGMVKIEEHHQYCHDLDFDLSSLEFLKNITKDPNFKCLDLSDKETWERAYNFTHSRSYRRGDMFDCLLTNGEKKPYSDIIKNSIKF
jgi:hypothetical protein